MTTINHLSAFLKLHTKIRLIVIDSIAFHFRQDLNDTTARSRMLSSVAQTLNLLAFDHNLGVVVVNHVTTRFERTNIAASTAGRGADAEDDSGNVGFPLTGANGSNSIAVSSMQRLVPALGEQWSHCITNRIMLHWHPISAGQGGGMQRMAALVKSPSMPFASASYCVNEKGIRDLPVSFVMQFSTFFIRIMLGLVLFYFNNARS